MFCTTTSGPRTGWCQKTRQTTADDGGAQTYTLCNRILTASRQKDYSVKVVEAGEEESEPMITTVNRFLCHHNFPDVEFHTVGGDAW